MIKNQGFTIIEILLTIGFTAIIATIGMLNLSGSRDKASLDSAFQKAAADLRLAQENARGQKNGLAWGMRFTNGTNDYWEMFSGNTYAGGTVVSKVSIPKDIKLLDPAEGQTKDILFSKVTGLPNAGATITMGAIKITSITETLTINTNGSITY